MTDISTVWNPALQCGDWVLKKASIQSRAINVSSPEIFGIGNGVANKFQLAPKSVIANILVQIYKNDWQGNQLQYSTPRTNQSIYSEQLDNAAYATRTNNASWTVNAAVAPDGTTTAYLFTGSGSVGAPYVDFYSAIQNDYGLNAGVTQTLTFHVKGGTATSIVLSENVGAKCVIFNPQTGAIISHNLVAPDVPISVPVANGFFRIGWTIAKTGIYAVTSVKIGTAYASTAPSTDTFYMWGVDFKIGALSSYLKTTTDPVSVIDYILGNSYSRTNVLLYSNDFENGAWSVNSGTVAKNAIAPDGTTTAHTFQANGGTGSYAVSLSQGYNNAPFNVLTSYTSSIYVKAGSYHYVRLGLSVAANATPSITLNLLTGAYTTNASDGATFAVTSMANGWYRISYSEINQTYWLRGFALFMTDYAGTSDGGASSSHTNADYIYVWKSQYEPGTIATNPIDTADKAITVADTPGLVTFSSTPSVGAILTWTGSYSLETTTPGGFLQTGNDLETAVLISLFSDRVANPDDKIPDGDPRGWIGDQGNSVPIGSRLWLLNRSKLTPALAPVARSMAAEALQWMIDDSVVANVDINTQIVLPNRLNMQVILYKQDGAKIAMDFTNAWAGMN